MSTEITTKDLEAYSRDQSICQVMPSGLVIPTSQEELREIVQRALEQRATDGSHTLTVRAGGTCMSGGPLSEGIIVSICEHLDNIISYDEESHTLWVEGGAWYRDVEDFLLQQGRMFAPYTSSKDICSIGGMVGNNASGERSFRYGATRDNVRSVRMICGDGNEYEFGPLSQEEFLAKQEGSGFEAGLYKTIADLYTANRESVVKESPSTKKNTAGYALDKIYDDKTDTWNFAKLIVGSQGTLGVITAVELETVSISTYHALYAVPINSFENVPDILEEVSKGNPEAIEVYDHTTLRLSCEADSIIRKHLEHLLDSKAVLLVEYGEETQEELLKKQQEFERICEEHKITFEAVKDTEIATCHWETRRNSYGLFKGDAEYGSPVPIIEDISVHRRDLDQLFDDIDAIMVKFGYEYVFHGHIGDASIRVFPLIDLSQDGARDDLIQMAEEVFAVVLEKNGTISTDHGDGIVRTPFLPMMYPEEIRNVFQEVKKAFDPEGIFNPGKKLSVTKEYLKDHIVM